MIGGMFPSTALTPVVITCNYVCVKRFRPASLQCQTGIKVLSTGTRTSDGI